MVEAKPLSTITEAKASNFIWRSIICRFGIPHTIVTDNGKQFNNEQYKNICLKLRIETSFSSPVHPQENGQMEVANNISKAYMKIRLDNLKGAWADELPIVLWLYRTTIKNAIGETTFSMAFGVEAIILVEVGMPNQRVQHFQPEENENQMCFELDILRKNKKGSNEDCSLPTSVSLLL